MKKFPTKQLILVIPRLIFSELAGGNMTEIGERLKKAREEIGLSYDELQEVTKIQKRYLQALEQGNYSVLPGTFYVRAFIKNYAEAVGLDPEQFLEEYSHELPRKEEPETTEFTPRANRIKETKKDSSKVMTFIPKFLSAIVLVGLVMGIWFFFQNYVGTDDQDKQNPDDIESEVGQGLPKDQQDDEQESPDEPANQEDQTEETEQPEEEPEQEAPKQVLEKVGQDGKDTFIYELKNASEFKVDVTLTNRCYIDIKDENNKLIDMKSNPDNKTETLNYNFSKYEKVTFNIGFSPNFQMKINGEQFEFEVKPEDQIHRYIVIKYTPTQGH
jgi:cytoskeletal protein RodZ